MAERGVYDFRHGGKAFLTGDFGKPFHDVVQFEDEHIHVIVLHRHVAPSTALETQFAQHLSGRERHIPHVVPRQGEIGGLLAECDVMVALLALGEHG